MGEQVPRPGVFQRLCQEAAKHKQVKKALESNTHVLVHELLPLITKQLRSSSLFSSALHDLCQPLQAFEANEHGALGAKALGRQAFQTGAYPAALKHYGDALRYLDETSAAGRLEACLLHGNRALCLLKLSPPRPQEAVLEGLAATRANPGSHKAEYRLASAYLACQQLQEALTHGLAAVQLLQASLQGHTGQGHTNLVKELADLEAFVSNVTSRLAQQSCSGSQQPAAEGTQSRGAAITARDDREQSVDTYLSQLTAGRVVLTDTGDAGRQLQAACAIQAGTDVFSEAPLASVLMKDHRQDCCWGCTKRLSGTPPAAPIYCKACAMVQYCSVECRDADVFHQPGGPECRALPWSWYIPEDALFAARLARRAACAAESHTGPRASHEASALQARGGQQQGGVPGALISGLVTHKDRPVPVSDALEWCVSAVLACDAYERARAHSAAQGKAPDNQQSNQMVSFQEPSKGLTPPLVVDSLLQIRANGVVLRPVASRDSGAAWGRAVYPALSCINHSCRQNLTLRFEGHTVIARSHQAIPRDQELTISYGPQEGEQLTPARQAFLTRTHYFTCHCPACQAPSLQEHTWGPYREAMACLQQGCPGGWGLQPGSMLASLLGQQEDVLEGYTGVLQTSICDVCGHVASKEALQHIEDEMAAAAEDMRQAQQVLLEARQQGVMKAQASVGSAARQLARGLHAWQRHLHAGNMLVGQAAFSCAEDVTALLSGVIEQHQSKQLLDWARMAASLHELGLSVMQLHYPAASVQCAGQMASLCQILAWLTAALEAEGDSAVCERRALYSRLYSLRATAHRVLSLHFDSKSAQAMLSAWCPRDPSSA